MSYHATGDVTTEAPQADASLAETGAPASPFNLALTAVSTVAVAAGCLLYVGGSRKAGFVVTTIGCVGDLAAAFMRS